MRLYSSGAATQRTATLLAALPAALLAALPAALLPALLLAAAAAGATAQQPRPVDDGRPLDPAGSVKIFNLYGSVRVIGWARDSVSVNGPLSLGERFMIGGSRFGLKIVVDAPEERRVRGAHLVVHVPVGARVWVKSASAEIEATGVRGGLDLYAVGGNISVAGKPAELNIETMDGSATVTGAPRWLRAKTATGDVTLNGGGDDVGVQTVSGRVQVSDAPRMQRARFETVTGAVRIDGSFDRGGSCTIDTHSGDVTLSLGAIPIGDFDVTSIAGRIENSISTARPTLGAGQRGAQLHFSTDPAGARIVVRTFKGTVMLKSGS